MSSTHSTNVRFACLSSVLFVVHFINHAAPYLLTYINYTILHVDEYFGFTCPEALNFNEEATVDDGSCESAFSSCPSDLSDDEFVGLEDLLLFLVDFGSVCE